jgi:hypothetical protein
MTSMTPDEVRRIEAAVHRYTAAKRDIAAAGHRAAAQLLELAPTIEKAVAAMRAAEVAEVAEHPDLAELNVQLDGFYGAAE